MTMTVRLHRGVGVLAVCVMTWAAGAAAADRITVVDDAERLGKWQGHGVRVSLSDDAASGKHALRLSGSGHVRLKQDVLKGLDVARYDRLVLRVKIPDGQVTDFGLVTRGFPQTKGIAYPRWAEYDESTPAGTWMVCSFDLRLPEWGGGRAKMVDDADQALSLLYTPGRRNTGILIDDVRLVKDPVRIAHDWVGPIRPLRVVRGPGGVRYEKKIAVRNVSARPVPVVVRFSRDSLKTFTGSVQPDKATLKPGGVGEFLVTIRVAAGLKPLEHERQTVEIVPGGDERLIQRVSMLTAAPFPSVRRAAARKAAKPGGVDALLAALAGRVRLPKHPCRWMSQSKLNAYGRWVYGGLGTAPEKFDVLTNVRTGRLESSTSLTGAVFHRWLIRAATKLGQAYAATGDRRYAAKAREIFLAYADGYGKYALDQPLTQASSRLCPGNATYVLGSVAMTPLARALRLIWHSDALSAADRGKIIDGLLYPAALEMMKIHPGMTNMQDAMNESLLHIGLLADDPNLVAEALYGSHGLRAKVNIVFDADGATPESIAAGYHHAALRPVLAQVEAVRSAGLKVQMNLNRLAKARTLMARLRMPDGRIPNRGDDAFPSGSGRADAELHGYGSMCFRHFGMTVLRSGRGRDALYVALDHRPPAVTHSHRDKLSIALYGLGEYLSADEGSLYNTDTRLQSGLPNWRRRAAWGHHALVHNTIVVDQADQQYGGAKLLYFHGAPGGYQAVAASTDNVYAGVTLERNIVMLGGVMVMVDRCLSDTSHTYDWTHHSFGKLSGPAGLKPRDRLGPKRPYSLPEDVRYGAVAGPASFTWQRKTASLRLTVLDEPGAATECATAIGWANQAYRKARQEAPFALVRRKGKRVAFVTVFEPFRGDAPTIGAIERVKVTGDDGRAVAAGDAVGLKITKGDQALYFLVSFTPGPKRCGPIRTDRRCFAAAARRKK